MEKKQYIAPKVSVTIIEGMTIMVGSLDPVNDQWYWYSNRDKWLGRRQTLRRVG